MTGESSSRPVFLIGYMASGKTTFGRALAQALHRPFIDLDELIERQQACSIPDLFARHGEPYFRALETAALREAADSGAVVACGGGTPCFGNNMDFMNQAGITVFLQASVPVIVRRLLEARQRTADGSRDPRDRRPLADSIPEEDLPLFISQALAKRLPAYFRAQIHFPSDRLESPTQIADSIAAFLPLLP